MVHEEHNKNLHFSSYNESMKLLREPQLKVIRDRNDQDPNDTITILLHDREIIIRKLQGIQKVLRVMIKEDDPDCHNKTEPDDNEHGPPRICFICYGRVLKDEDGVGDEEQWA